MTRSDARIQLLTALYQNVGMAEKYAGETTKLTAKAFCVITEIGMSYLDEQGTVFGPEIVGGEGER